ncbi:hypothetical protein Droror1_Dr00003307 [Drosera rotundifolia]
MNTKRIRAAAEEIEIQAMANCLQLLSQQKQHIMSIDSAPTTSSVITSSSSDGLFSCKTCHRTFTSFQALGGHSASHNKMKSSSKLQSVEVAGVVAAEKVHRCSICGLEFPMGQSLGGHMRKHRALLHGSKEGLPLSKAPAAQPETPLSSTSTLSAPPSPTHPCPDHHRIRKQEKQEPELSSLELFQLDGQYAKEPKLTRPRTANLFDSDVALNLKVKGKKNEKIDLELRLALPGL